MKVTLLWPFGDYEPGDGLDLDPKLGEVLCREGFARPSEGEVDPIAPSAPTVAELRTYAIERGLTLSQAKRQLAAELRGAQTCE